MRTVVGVMRFSLGVVHLVEGFVLGQENAWGCGFEGLTCDPKPYKIVGYDPLIRGQNP